MYEDIVYTERSSDKSPHRLPTIAAPPINKQLVAASVYEKPAGVPVANYVKQAGIPNTHPQHVRPVVVATKRVHSGEPIKMVPTPPCRSCGHTDHTTQLCPVLFYTDANNDLHIEWCNSVVGRLWGVAGFPAYNFDYSLPGYENRLLKRDQGEYHPSMLNLPRAYNSNNNKRARFEQNSGGGQQGFVPCNQQAGPVGMQNFVPYGQQSGPSNPYQGTARPQANAQGPSNPYQGMTLPQVDWMNQGMAMPQTNSQFAVNCRTKKQGKVTLASLLADTISKIDVDTNYLISRIFINQHGSPPNNRGCTNPQPHLPSHEVQAEVLLDTGSLPGDFISQNLVHKLHGEKYIYVTNSPLTVCSGLDNTCYIRDKVIDIGLTFVTHSLVIKMIYITVRVIRNTIDFFNI